MERYQLRRKYGKWEILAEGHPQALAEFDTREEAMEAMTVFLGGRTASLTIYTEDGFIDAERFYPAADEEPAAH